MADLLATLIYASVAGSVAILLVLVVRIPARQWFGPEIAYRLWAIPPAAALAALLPSIGVPRPGGAAMRVTDLSQAFNSPALATPVLLIWLAGALAMVLAMTFAHRRFLARAKVGLAGPAVVGVICPRIVMPGQADLYAPDQWALIRAHEHEHIVRGDPRATAVLGLTQCLMWWNPLVHLAAYLTRIDQELACDAAVLRLRPRARRRYAETLLETQLARTATPFGCAWPARSRHPLELRIALLKTAGRERPLSAIGGMVIAVGVVVIAGTIWAIPKGPEQPDAAWRVQERPIYVEIHHPRLGPVVIPSLARGQVRPSA